MNNQSSSWTVVRSQHRGGGSGGGHGRHPASSRGRASHRRDEHDMRYEARGGQHDRSSPSHLVPNHRGSSTSSIYRPNSASAPALRERDQSHHPGSSRSRKQDTYQRRIETNTKYDRSTDSIISEEGALRDASNVMGRDRVPADGFNRNKNAESYAKQSNSTHLFNDTHTIPELIQIAYDNLGSLKPSFTAAFWNKVLKQISGRNAMTSLRLPNHQEQELGSRLNQILKHTAQTVSQFGPMHLSQAIYSLAKIVDVLRKSKRVGLRGGDIDITDVLSDLLMNRDMSLKKEVFRSFAIVSVGKLRNFDVRHLSNIAYAYALIRYVPEVNEGRSCLFDHLAIEAQAVQRRTEFIPRQLSNIVWAYATVNKSNPVLFEAMGNQIVAFKHLNGFNSQDLSNTVWAFAKCDIPHPALFEVVANHIAGLDSLDRFTPQNLANTVWAYATTNIPHPPLFKKVADRIVESDSLDRFNYQNLSNTIWAYATSGIRNPKLFEKAANHITRLDYLGRFDPQALANIVWAYATADIPNRNLFEKVASHIVQSDILDRFNSQNLANTVWAYATANIPHPELFQKVANHITGLDSLDRFKPQEIVNTVWAYATADVPHRKLFEKVADYITRLDSLNRFNSQDLVNIVCAYATTNIPHPPLFKKVANHIVHSGVLDRFNSQALSNTVWAYAKADMNHSKLFKKVATHIIQSDVLDQFDPQHLSITVWAYATMGMVDRELFSSVIPRAAKSIDSFDNQGLPNMAWAYAVADVDAPTLFNDYFDKKCVEKKDEFNIKELCQLHQWHLWQAGEKSHDGLPQELLNRCYEAFISRDQRVSKLQEDVVTQLSSIGLEPREEVLLDSGYRVDAIVQVDEKTIGVEVDGPYHFIGRSKLPTGSTILKRRQVPSIDGIVLVSVPYWEWDKFGTNQVKKQEYLRKLLRITT